MPLYCIRNIDTPNAEELKPPHTGGHMAWVESRLAILRLAGPLRNPGGARVGAMYVFEAADGAEAKAISDADPYKEIGAYAVTEIHEFTVMRGGFA